MNKQSKHNQKSELKSHDKRSHNPNLALIEFVKFLARQSADEDYKNLQMQPNNHKIIGKDND